MSIEESCQFITSRMHWNLDNIQVLDMENCTWIAFASTTHLKELGKEEELQFIIIVQGTNHLAFENTVVSTLGAWCLANDKDH